jgi:hypothetical protein
MPRQHQKRNILSPQETQLNRWLSTRFDHTQFAVNQLIGQNILPQGVNIQIPLTIGNTIVKMFSGLPLSALVDNWSDYGQNFLPDVWDVDPSEMQPRRGMRASWPSAHRPLFHWNNGEPRWGDTSANHYSHRRVLPSSSTGSANSQQIHYHRARRQQDPAAIEFFRIINSCTTQEDLVEQLNSRFPPTDWWSEYDERRNTAWVQSIDFVLARQHNWNRALNLDTMENSNHLTAIAPLCAFEYDGMTGFRVVNGNIEWSPDAVGSSRKFRWPDGAYNAGEVKTEEVERRLAKMNDKIAILRDIEIPSTVLPYDSLRVFSGPGFSFMAADISLNYLFVSSRYTNGREPEHGTIDNPENLWSILAPQMSLGCHYTQLCNSQYSGPGGVTIERIEDAAIPTDIIEQEDDINADPYTVSIVQPHLLTRRMDRYRRNPASFFRNVQVDPQNCTGIKMSINHPQHDLIDQSIALNPLYFSGSTICPENDHVMLAGWAAHMILDECNRRDGH